MKTFKRSLAVLTAGIMGAGLFGTSVYAKDNGLSQQNIYFSTQTINQSKAAIDLARINKRELIVKTKKTRKFNPASHGLASVTEPDILKEEGIQVFAVPAQRDYETVLAKVQKDTAVDYAEPNYLAQKTAVSGDPNDRLYSRQWALKKIHWTKNLANPAAGQKPVIVAVLDTGVDADHPDLKGKVLKGKDFVNHFKTADDTVGHGTEVSGIIAATVDNKRGISGINNNVRILPVRVGGKVSFPSSSIVAGLHYAIDHGAKVINMSFGGGEPSQAQYDAILEAVSKGITLVAASGNEHPVYGVNYPAAYPQVISVGATRYNDVIAPFSSRGPQLDLTAPGTEIMTTKRNGTYGSKDVSGTSFSAPMVSGVASLLLSKNPSLKPQQIEYMLEKSAFTPDRYKNSAGLSDLYGYGRVEAAKALQVKMPSTAGDAADKPSKAKLVSPGKSYTDRFNLPFDGDMFKFKLSKEKNVRIEVSAVKGIDPVIAVNRMDKNGRLTYEKIQDRNGVGKGEVWSAKLKSGTSYITVYEANNHWSTKSYTMKLK
ncbi:Subtilase family protein [Fictibacillus solisalsi]|uniref:Subtilase family protein n=1 Tax=Fictibacillus solisalsi TaxID=459525 RepID=A0A1G9Y3P6_9BACL|nr:S8 family serine peptidase [Fictibacillus solisalsi]SDN03065.1 Subtilase family protein [Fictibacillus solisalsi]